MSETKQTPWLIKTYSAQLEQSASDIVAKIETLSSSIGESANWNSTYSEVSNGSANWNSVYSDFANNSSSFIQTYSTVSTNSAYWNSGHGIASVFTDGTTVSGDGTEESKIGLIGPQYNFVAGDNMTIVTSGNDLIFSSTGGTASGDYLPLSGGVVSGTTTISGNSFDTQLILARKQANDETQSAYCGVDIYGGPFLKAAQGSEQELHINSDGLSYKTVNGSKKSVALYNSDEVSGYEAFGFDNNGNPTSVQPAGKYVKFVDPTTQTNELRIQYLRGIRDAANIPETSNYPTLWVVVSAVE